MRNKKVIKANVFVAFFLLLTAPFILAQERRAMTLDDVMDFHHMSSPVISFDGKWIAYTAAPDYGDGYGVLVSSDNKSEFRFERAEAPQFSAEGDWLMFRQVPPHAETRGKSSGERPKDGTLLIKTADGEKSVFENVKSGRFSEVGSFLFLHKHSAEDSTLSDEQNEKLKKAGTPLVVRNLERNSEIILPFVDSWTIDSLSTTLVYTINDTLEKNNGLWYLSLQDITSSPVVIDTTGKGSYSSFTWHEKESRLAYTREDDIEKDTVETAVLFSWSKNKVFPDPLLYQEDAPEGYFLPFDNRLEWSNNGEMLFFGFRPEEYSAKPEEQTSWNSIPDSIRHQADIDIWHGDDPFIKTHEKELWSRMSRQNLMSVYHINDRKFIQLADKEITDLDPPVNGDYALATTNIPHRKRITWEGWLRDAYVLNLYTGNKDLVAKELRDITELSPGGRHVIYFENKHWYVYDIESRETRNLTVDLDIPFYDETNDTPSPPSSYRIAGWMEDGESVLIYDRYDIWHVNLVTGSMHNITNGRGREWHTTFRIRKLNNDPLFKNSETLFLEGFNDETKVRSIFTARPDRQGVTIANDEGKNLRLRLISDDERTIVFTRESYHEFPDLWVTNTRFSNPVRISRLGEQTSRFNWGTAELVSFNSADGVPLQGVIIKPGDYDPSKRYPVFVYYYEKFSQRLHDFNQTVINHSPSFGYYASNGYVIFLPDIHFY
jgi:dipeptidyl aminopeptidase/acylaminoacyl peptidase